VAMNFEELDEKTRKYMLDEFEAEQAGRKPYWSKDLSTEGLAAFPCLMLLRIRIETRRSSQSHLPNKIIGRGAKPSFRRSAAHILVQ